MPTVATRTRVEALSNTEDWETRDGEIVRFDEMTLDHARNLHAWLLRNADLWRLAHSIAHRPLELWDDEDAEAWMRRTALHRRITARIEELEGASTS